MRRELVRLREIAFDLLVIGGGMHGAWIARRASEAGFSVALIEKDDFAGATSGNSLNILHGGLRYLQHLDLPRMRASIRARREFSRQSPHLVMPLPCVMPLQRVGIRSPWIMGPALLLNDLFSADRNAGVSESARLPGGQLLGAQDCRARIAPLAEVSASAGALWWDALSLDSARICLETLIAAARAGAVVVNRIEALSYLTSNQAVHGVAARDRLSGQQFEIKSSVVVNATGPSAGVLARASLLAAPYLPEAWVGALNLVLTTPIRLDSAIALSSVSRSADDSAVLRRGTRDLFFVPCYGALAVGTDYVALDPGAGSGSRPPPGAIASFVEEASRVASRANLRAEDVAKVHWGILPGAPGAGDVPAKKPILASGHAEAGADGLVIAIGEKLTSAPSLSLAVLARVSAELAQSRQVPPRSSSQSEHPREASHDSRLMSEATVARLTLRYGANWSETLREYSGRRELFEPVLAEQALLAVEVVHAVREEMAIDLDDLLLRRLALAQAGDPAPEMVRRCAAIASPEFGWTESEQVKAVAEFEARQAVRVREMSPGEL